MSELLSEEEKNLVSYKVEYEKGETALLDYEIQKYRVDSHKKMLECIDLNIWLDELLIRI